MSSESFNQNFHGIFSRIMPDHILTTDRDLTALVSVIQQKYSNIPPTPINF